MLTRWLLILALVLQPTLAAWRGAPCCASAQPDACWVELARVACGSGDAADGCCPPEESASCCETPAESRPDRSTHQSGCDECMAACRVLCGSTPAAPAPSAEKRSPQTEDLTGTWATPPVPMAWSVRAAYVQVPSTARGPAATPMATRLALTSVRTT